MNKDIASSMNMNSKNQIRVYPTQTETQSLGTLRVRCTNLSGSPIANASVSISLPSDPSIIVEQMTTDVSGLSPEIQLSAPPIEYSLAPNEPQPYSEYNITVKAASYETNMFSNVQLLPTVLAEQDAVLSPQPTEEATFVIDPHTLYAVYPPKIPEAEIKPTAETGEIVLPQVVIPEYVIVHDGPPSDTSAANHYERFTDYIKNVACSEIYATWPETTIYANVLAILSFTLNRVYTEWYRNQGHNFTITSSTAFDHKWINGRNIFNNVSDIVDSVFVNYLSRPNVRQPILTQYCDGNRVSCPGWMTQWGSKTLGDQGYSAINILKNFYGSDIYINTASQVSGVPRSWPGSNLTTGSRGDSVRTIQQQLNRISDVYSAIPKLVADGVYGSRTAQAVKTFQQVFGLPQTGIVDIATWYKISQIYVAVTRLAQ